MDDDDDDDAVAPVGRKLSYLCWNAANLLFSLDASREPTYGLIIGGWG